MFIGAIDAPVKKGELIQVERRGKKRVEEDQNNVNRSTKK